MVADSIYADHWNYHSTGGAGNIGLGMGSPIWQIFGNPSVKQFDITLGCTAWITLLPPQCAGSLSTLVLNGFNSAVTVNPSASTVIKPTT